MPSNRSRLINSGPATTARESRLGMVGAVLLHASVVGATYITWTTARDFPSMDVPVVPVELVTIADQTSIRAQSPEPPAPEPQETPPQEAAAPPPEPEKVEVAPEPKVVEKAPAPKPEPKPEPPKPKVVEQPKPKFDINNIMALLDKTPTETKAPNTPTGERSIRGAGLQDAMTMQLGDALRNQIAQCWNPPVGSPNPERLVVTFRMFLSPDGTVARAPQLTAESASAAARDAFTNAAAEAARRAIYGCMPYKLPANRYSQWRDIEVTFDPRKMAGLN